MGHKQPVGGKVIKKIASPSAMFVIMQADENNSNQALCIFTKICELWLFGGAIKTRLIEIIHVHTLKIAIS